MLENLRRIVDPTGFVPRAVCGNWTRGEVLLNNISDLLVALAYVSIPVMLVIFARRRRDFPMSWLSGVFAAFILSCGATHVMEIVLFYYPVYRLAGYVKAVTALASWVAVFALYKILPTALSLHSPYQLQVAKDELTRSHLQLQESLAQRNQELTAKNQQLQEANEARSRFLANLSHELRTPMVSILGLSEMALIDRTWNSRETLIKIHEAARSQNAFLSDLLEFSSSESRALSLREAPLQLENIISELRSTLSWMAERKKIELDFHIDESLAPLWFLGDASRIRHVLMNLTQNAIKFTERGSVEVRVSTVVLSNQETTMLFLVADTGLGIPEDRLKDIYEPFIQIDDSLTKKEAGSGLGLALCQEMLELMGSEVQVQSELGVGSNFSFHLNLAIVAPPQRLEVAAIEVRILLVEDNPINQAVMQAILRKFGHSVHSASTGAEALSLIEQHEFDLALLDLQLPDIDGFTLAERIAKKLPKLPMLALTAHGESAYKTKALSIGLKDFLVKPVPTDDLLQSIDKALKNKS